MSLPMRRVPISPRGPLFHARFPEAAPRGEEPARGSIRARARPAGGDRARALGTTDSPCTERPTTARATRRSASGAAIGLRVLARLLPLLDEAEVYLLGTGLPSFWSIRMGEMRLLLGLSGWTANDWTGATALDQLAPPAEPSDALLGDIAATFQARPALTFNQIRERTGAAPAFVAAGSVQARLAGPGRFTTCTPGSIGGGR